MIAAQSSKVIAMLPRSQRERNDIMDDIETHAHVSEVAKMQDYGT